MGVVLAGIWNFINQAQCGKNTIYSVLIRSARRVLSRVLVSDSLGSFCIIGLMAHPSPDGTSRVSEIARHSTCTPPSRS